MTVQGLNRIINYYSLQNTTNSHNTADNLSINCTHMNSQYVPLGSFRPIYIKIVITLV